MYLTSMSKTRLPHIYRGQNYVINFIDNYEFGVVNYKSLDKLKTL